MFSMIIYTGHLSPVQDLIFLSLPPFLQISLDSKRVDANISAVKLKAER